MPRQASEGGKYSVDARGGLGVQVGERNTQIIYTYNRLTWTDGVAPPPLISVSGEIDSPYRGLSAFEEQDAAFFYGREAATTELLERMSWHLGGVGLLMVSGVSGAGKSSLLRAGVLPRIRGAGLASAPGSASWPCLVFTPARAPLDELALRVASLAGADAAAVRRGLDTDSDGFALTARQAALAQPPAPGGPVADRHRQQHRLLLVVDQFEQLFTQCPDEGQRRAFITALHAAASAGHGIGQMPAALVVLGVRADFEARCADYPQLATAVQDRYLVTSMTERQLRMAITEPAKRAGSRVDDDLAGLLLSEVRARQPGALGAGVLPLLSHALDQAWRSRTGDDVTLADYERTGGIEGAVADSAQHAYDRLTPAQQAAARQVFTRLTATSSDGVDTADRATRAELTEGKSTAEAQNVEAVLEAFAAERLLTLAADSVEISHEVLLTAWPLLRDTWLAETHADRIVLTRLHNTAAEWTRHSRDRSYLYSGSLLQAADETAARVITDPARYPPLSQAERDFLHASNRARRRAARRPYEVIAALVVLLALAVSGGFYALGQRNLARRQGQAARIGQLVAESRAVIQSDPRTSLLLALDAYHQQATPQTYAQLLTAVTQTRYAGILLGHTSAIESLAYRPRGNIVASGDDQGTVILWNAAGQSRLASFRARDPVWDLAFSPDGDTLAVGTRGRSVQLWNLADPAHPTLLTTLSALGNGDLASISHVSVAFTPDGKTLAATDDGRTLTVWDVAHRAHPVLLSQTNVLNSYSLTVAGPAGKLAFSPDGQTLLIGSDFDATATLWDMSDPSHPSYLSALPSPQTGAGTFAVAFSPDGHTVATESGFTAYTYLWDVTNRSAPTLISTMTGQGGKVVGLAFSPDGSRLATASQDGTTALWNVTTPARPVQVAALSGQKGSVNTAAFSPDGHALATGSNDHTVMLWHADTNVNIPAVASVTVRDRTDAVTALAYGGHILAVGHAHGTVELWDTTDPARPRWLATLPAQHGSGGPADITNLAFSPDNHTLAVSVDTNGSLNNTGVVILWDISDPRKPSELTSLPDQAQGTLAIDPAGTIVATLSAHNKIIFSSIADPRAPRAEGATAAFPGTDNPDTVTFSPGNHIVAIGHVGPTGGLTLYDISDPRAPRHLANLDTADPAVYAIAFSPNGGLMASTTTTGGVLLWKMTNPAHPARIANLTGNTGVTTGVAFGPGHTLVTAGYDQTANVWDLTDPAHPVQTASLTGQAGIVSVVRPVDFSSNGHTLATASSDSKIVLWDITRLTAIMRQPVLSACRITSPHTMPANWLADVPGTPYHPGCP